MRRARALLDDAEADTFGAAHGMSSASCSDAIWRLGQAQQKYAEGSSLLRETTGAIDPGDAARLKELGNKISAAESAVAKGACKCAGSGISGTRRRKRSR